MADGRWCAVCAFPVHQTWSLQSLYSYGPWSCRPQPLGSGGDATPCEDPRQEHGPQFKCVAGCLFNGSPHVVFFGCGCHVPALACRAREVPSRPRHVQSFNGRRAHAQRWKPNAPEPEHMGRVRGVPRRSELHSPSASSVRDVVGCSAGGLCQVKQSSPQKTGEPRREPEGRRPEERWAPTQILAFRYLTRYIFDSWRSSTDVLDFAYSSGTT